MRKLILLLVFAGVLASCGVSKTERQAQKTFKGDWTLNSVQLPSALVDVALFDDVDTRCFENSEWNFVPNNNKGTYQIYNENCQTGKRKFRWNIQENKEDGEYYFTLKQEVDGVNIRQEKRGFRLKLVYLDDQQMNWEQTVSYEGKPFTIKMSFSKN